MSISYRYLILVTTSLLLVSTSITKAQDSLRISLQDARKIALENNATIRNSAIDMEIARKKVWETMAIGLPHIDAKAAYQYLPVVPTLPPGTMGRVLQPWNSVLKTMPHLMLLPHS